MLQIWQRSVEFFRGDLFGRLYVGSKQVKHTQVLVELAYSRLCLLLQVCMDLETMAKTFDDLVVILVICFAQDNLESSFTPRYA